MKSPCSSTPSQVIEPYVFLYVVGDDDESGSRKADDFLRQYDIGAIN